MPASKHTRVARTAKAARQWGRVAASMEKRGFSRGRAIRAANSVVKRDYMKKRSRKRY